jgi:phosphoserine phosphatase RsbU/P
MDTSRVTMSATSETPCARYTRAAPVATYMIGNLPGELAAAVVGSLFVGVGVGSIAAASSARPRAYRAGLWFGVFCLLYGVRLVAQSTLVQALTPWSPTPFDYIEAFVTYTILVPAGLFVETLVGPGWHMAVRRTWQLTCVYAAGAILNDVARGRPYASMWLNAPVLLFTLGIQLAHIVVRARRDQRWPAEIRAVAATAALFVTVALYETVSPTGLLGDEFDAEPLAMLLFTTALGWFVLTRAREQAYAFVALSRELQLARDIQHSLLPQQMLDVPGLRIEGAYLPMSAVAGDFYDVVLREDGCVVLIVADVSGHGVPAALVASMVKVAFAAEVERYDCPGAILGGINRALTGKFDRAYVTACCAVVSRSLGSITYSAAGHPPALLRRRDGRIERIDEGGTILTMLPGATYRAIEVAFDPGDQLLMFTDGVLEASRGSDEEFFGDAEFVRIVADPQSTSTMSQSVLRAHRQWIGNGAALSDDVTLLVVERLA